MSTLLEQRRLRTQMLKASDSVERLTVLIDRCDTQLAALETEAALIKARKDNFEFQAMKQMELANDLSHEIADLVKHVETPPE